MEAVQGLRKARFERETWTYFALLYLHNGRGSYLDIEPLGVLCLVTSARSKGSYLDFEPLGVLCLVTSARSKGMATFQVTPPENFSFMHPEEWPKWIRRFERFRQVSGLDAKEEETQMDPNLTLEKAVAQSRQAESVKKQQAIIRCGQSQPQPANIDAVSPGRQQQQPLRKKGPQLAIRKSTQAGRNDSWLVTLQLNEQPVIFKLDTGADVTVIPMGVLRRQREKTKLYPAQKRLHDPNNQELPVRGCLKATLAYRNATVVEEVYVVPGLHTPLLGRPAIESSGLITRVASIGLTGDQIPLQYPNTCSRD
eukprot:Em0006g808a